MKAHSRLRKRKLVSKGYRPFSLSLEHEFKCTHKGCAKTFTNKTTLMQHIKQHESGSKAFKCSVEGCYKSFIQRTQLLTHLRTHKPGEGVSFRCTFVECETYVDTVESLLQHESEVHSHKLFPCTFPGCGKSFTQRGNLGRHAEKHKVEQKQLRRRGRQPTAVESLAADGPWTCMCAGCRESYESEAQLSDHMRAKHNVKAIFPCPMNGCKKLFIRQGNLKLHLETHLDRGLCCTVAGCKRVFTRKRNFDRHLERHEYGGETYDATNSNSEEDGKESSEEEDQEDDEEEVPQATRGTKGRKPAAPVTQMIACPKRGCKQVYASHSLLQNHLRDFHGKSTVTPAKQFRCPVAYCRELFAKKSLLYLHTLSNHEEEKGRKRWLCPVEGCDKILPRRYAMAVHYNEHFDECDDADDQDKSLMCLESLDDDTLKATTPKPLPTVINKTIDKSQDPDLELFMEEDFLERNLEYALLSGLYYIALDSKKREATPQTCEATQNKSQKEQRRHEKALQQQKHLQQLLQQQLQGGSPVQSQTQIQPQPQAQPQLQASPTQQTPAQQIQLQQQIQTLQQQQQQLQQLHQQFLHQQSIPTSTTIQQQMQLAALMVMKNTGAKALQTSPTPLPNPTQTLLSQANPALTLAQQSLQLQQLHLQQLQQLQLNPQTAQLSTQIAASQNPRLSQLLLQQHLLQLGQLQHQPK